MRGCMLVLVALLATGCSAKSYHLATVSVVSAHATASLVQDQADAWTCGAPTAVPEHCLSVEKRRELATVLSPAFDRIGKAAVFVKAWPADAPPPVQLSALLAEITDLLNKGLALLPETAQRWIVQHTTGGAK